MNIIVLVVIYIYIYSCLIAHNGIALGILRNRYTCICICMVLMYSSYLYSKYWPYIVRSDNIVNYHIVII